MKHIITRQGRNGKLSAKIGRHRSRLKDGILHPEGNALRVSWRRAMAERGRLEREAMWAQHPDYDSIAESLRKGSPTYRLEEKAAITLFKDLPTVFAIMEGIHPGYVRPSWADRQFGAR